MTGKHGSAKKSRRNLEPKNQQPGRKKKTQEQSENDDTRAGYTVRTTRMTTKHVATVSAAEITSGAPGEETRRSTCQRATDGIKRKDIPKKSPILHGRRTGATTPEAENTSLGRMAKRFGRQRS